MPSAMKLHHLQALVAVTDHGGIRAAARALHLSQAALTKSLRQLEDDAATPLLRRHSRGVGLTEAGERLLAHARLITRQLQLAEEDLHQAAGEDTGTLRVGLVPLLTLTALPEVFAWFRQRYRRVQLQFTEGLVARVVPALREGTLDLAVVALDVHQQPGHGLQQRLLRQEPQCVVARSGHALHRSEGAPALSDCEWLLTSSLLADAGARLQPMFGPAGLPLPTRLVSSEAMGTLALLRSTDVVSVLPRSLLGRPATDGIAEVRNCPLRAADLQLALLQRPETPLTPAAEYFAHCLVQVVGSGQAAQDDATGSGAGDPRHLRSPGAAGGKAK